MTIQFGSPEALAIIEADRKLAAELAAQEAAKTATKAAKSAARLKWYIVHGTQTVITSLLAENIEDARLRASTDHGLDWDDGGPVKITKVVDDTSNEDQPTSREEGHYREWKASQ
jgi:hypothetical protein